MYSLYKKTPRVGLEPTTPRLTAECSTIELSRNIRYTFIVPSKPHTEYYIFPFFATTFFQPFCGFLIRRIPPKMLRIFVGTFAPQSYASAHPCPRPLCARVHSCAPASAFLRFWISLRPISSSQLRALLHFHPCPIYLVFSKGS